jgi:hypothetical protein
LCRVAALVAARQHRDAREQTEDMDATDGFLFVVHNAPLVALRLREALT